MITSLQPYDHDIIYQSTSTSSRIYSPVGRRDTCLFLNYAWRHFLTSFWHLQDITYHVTSCDREVLSDQYKLWIVCLAFLFVEISQKINFFRPYLWFSSTPKMNHLEIPNSHGLKCVTHSLIHELFISLANSRTQYLLSCESLLAFPKKRSYSFIFRNRV